MHVLSPVMAFEENCSIYEQQKDWNNSATLPFSDFHEPSVSYQHFSDPHQVIVIGAPPNDAMV